MNDEDTRWSWHDQRGVTWAAGVAAVALIVLLVWAVLRTANGSSLLPDSGPPAPSDLTSEFTRTSTTTSRSTSYPVPSVQTSEGGPPTAVPAPSDVPAIDEPTISTPTSTSIFNPYVTTTQPPGGAV